MAGTPAPRRPPPFSLALALAWAAPLTALGLAAGGMARVAGARWRVVDGVVEVTLRGGRRRRAWLARCPFAAITLGHVVIAVGAREMARLRAHEREHVRQAERWGPLFALAYPAASVWQWLRGRRAYWDNPFEVAARQADARHAAPSRRAPPV